MLREAFWIADAKPAVSPLVLERIA
jgi:hypothetical protein